MSRRRPTGRTILIGALGALALSTLGGIVSAFAPLLGHPGLSSAPGGLVFRLDDSTDLARVDGSWYVVDYGARKHALHPSTNGGHAIQVGPLLLWPREPIVGVYLDDKVKMDGCCGFDIRECSAVLWVHPCSCEAPRRVELIRTGCAGPRVPRARASRVADVQLC